MSNTNIIISTTVSANTLMAKVYYILEPTLQLLHNTYCSDCDNPSSMLDMLDNLACVCIHDMTEDDAEYFEYVKSFMNAYASYPTCAEKLLSD